jgi:hypothetical protein
MVIVVNALATRKLDGDLNQYCRRNATACSADASFKPKGGFEIADIKFSTARVSGDVRRCLDLVGRQMVG